MRFRRHKRTFGAFMVAVVLTMASPDMRACRLCNGDGDGSCMAWADCTSCGDDQCIQQPFNCGHGHVAVNCGCGSSSCLVNWIGCPNGAVECEGRDPNGSVICSYKDTCAID